MPVTITSPAPATTAPLITDFVFPERIRERFAPHFAPNNEQSVYALSWILTHDWTITDDEREMLVFGVALWGLYGAIPRSSTAAREGRGGVVSRDLLHYINTWSAACRTLNAYKPCEECGKLVRHCRQCGECPGCDSDIEQRPCGHCTTCTETCESCHTCSECPGCTCANCEACDRRVTSVCEVCRQCESCCECVHCRACERPCSETCEHYDDEDESYGHESGYCESCCAEDRRGDSSHSISGAGATHPAKSPADRKVFRSKRMAGLEIEYNDCEKFKPIATYCRTWGAEVHSDGSCGWEVVTSPAAGDKLIQQIADAAKALSKAGATCNGDCGLHVHVDARDLTWTDTARLVRLWARLEPAMYLLAGDHRAENNYCEPWGTRLVDALNDKENADDPKGAILSVLYRNDYDDPKGALAYMWKQGRSPEKKAGFRYKSLNLAPWIARWRAERKGISKDGGRFLFRKKLASDATVEFRLHEGTHDPVELREWTRLLVKIVDYVVAATDREVADLPRSAMRALCLIAPECKAWIMGKLRTYRKRFRTSQRRTGYHPRIGYTIGKTEAYGEWISPPAEFADWTGSWGVVREDSPQASWYSSNHRMYQAAVRSQQVASRNRPNATYRVVPHREEFVRNEYACFAAEGTYAGERLCAWMRSQAHAEEWARRSLGPLYPSIYVRRIDMEEPVARFGNVARQATQAPAPTPPTPPTPPVPTVEITVNAPAFDPLREAARLADYMREYVVQGTFRNAPLPMYIARSPLNWSPAAPAPIPFDPPDPAPAAPSPLPPPPVTDRVRRDAEFYLTRYGAGPGFLPGCACPDCRHNEAVSLEVTRMRVENDARRTG